MRHTEGRRSRTPEDVEAPWSAPLLSAGANAPAHERLAALTALLIAIATPVAVGFHDFFHGGTWLFLLPRVYRFGDYSTVYARALEFRPGKSIAMVYSPLMHLLMTALTYLSERTGFVIVVAVFVAVLVLVCWKWITAVTTLAALRLLQVAVLALLSYPVLFVIDRGNLEMVVFVFLAAFFYLYYVRHSRWAWIPLALAIGSKYYWVTLLVLPLSDRQMRQAVYALLGAVGGSLAAVVLIAWNTHYTVGSVLHHWFQTLVGGRGAYVGSLWTAQHSHTLWASSQISNHLLGYRFSGVLDNVTGYFLVAALLFLLIAYEVLSHDLAPWRKVLALVAATLVLPVESFDYTLLHLYFPLALLVCCATMRWPARLAGLLIGVCLVPVDYHYFARGGADYDVGISTFIYCGALVALILVALVTRERERRPLRSLLVWDSWSARIPKAAAPATADAPGAATDAVSAVASPAATDVGGLP